MPQNICKKHICHGCSFGKPHTFVNKHHTLQNPFEDLGTLLHNSEEKADIHKSRSHKADLQNTLYHNPHNAPDCRLRKHTILHTWKVWKQDKTSTYLLCKFVQPNTLHFFGIGQMDYKHTKRQRATELQSICRKEFFSSSTSKQKNNVSDP